jgi:hypothetical protein
LWNEASGKLLTETYHGRIIKDIITKFKYLINLNQIILSDNSLLDWKLRLSFSPETDLPMVQGNTP